MPMRYYAMLLHCSANMRPSWRALCKSFPVTPCFHSTGEETKCIFIFSLYASIALTAWLLHVKPPNNANSC